MNDPARRGLLLGDETLPVVSCLHCGLSNQADSHFCRECGKPLTPAGSTRSPLQLFLLGLAVSILVTILVVLALTFIRGMPLA